MQIVAYLAILVLACAGWALLLLLVGLNPRVVPAQPRSPVPWNIFDVLVIFVLQLAGVIFTASLIEARGLFPAEAPVPAEWPVEAEAPAVDGQPVPDPDLERAHSLIVLLHGDRSWWMLSLVILAAVVVAPLAEEFFYRLILQGYLEKAEGWIRRLLFAPPMFRGTGAIALASLLFAVMHFRVPGPPPPVHTLQTLMLAQVVGTTVGTLLAIVYLVVLYRPTWSDFGIDPRHIGTDVGLGLVGFFVVAVPLFSLQLALSQLLPWAVVDPLPLFLFSCGLGFLYFRTHRIVPAIAMHAALNATSVTIFLTYADAG